MKIPKGIHFNLGLMMTAFGFVVCSLQPVTAVVESPKGFLPQEIPISILNGVEEEDPVVTSDGKNFWVVWQTDRKNPDDYDVYAARVSPDGKLLDPQGLPVSTAPSNQIFSDIAVGKEQSLVVWQDLRSHSRWEVYGARLRSDGKVLDEDGIPIAVGRGNARHPQVGWDGQNFLVVWMEENPGRGWDIAGARVSPNGKVIDPDRILIAPFPGDQSNPVLAWGNDQYLVAWMDKRPGSPARILGARVSASGKLRDPEGFVLSRSSVSPSFPAVSWAQGQYVVVWADQQAPSTHALAGIRLDSSGNVDGSKEFVVESSPNLHMFPSVHCSGELCLVVWEKDQYQGRPRGIQDVLRDVKGAWIDLSQKTVTPQEVMIAPKAVGNHFAKVASTGREYLVVWKDYRTGTASSVGRFVTPPR
ncbi:MAG TPA: hypothetical protein VFH55_04150 [Nitrospiria bacterium]|nr:hypothetical protein [Nitrospiria bacterium]